MMNNIKNVLPIILIFLCINVYAQRNGKRYTVNKSITIYSTKIKNSQHKLDEFISKNSVKLLNTDDVNYSFVCFQYIHQNPLKAGLVNRMEDWEFSSYKDYLIPNKSALCNHLLARDLIGFDESSFLKESLSVMNEENMKHIFNKELCV